MPRVALVAPLVLICVSYAVVGVVVVGASWYLTRLARGPAGMSPFPSTPPTGFHFPPRAVVWTKENPTPWNDIKPDEGTKLLTVNQHFDKRYAPPSPPTCVNVVTDA